jgi:tetratricopeptide (TPR) repeat protein
MLVFETETFSKESKEHGLENHVIRTSERIRSATTRLDVSDCVGKYYAHLLIDKQANFRLVGDIRQMDDGEDVFIWLRVLVRGGAEYSNFAREAERIRHSVDRRSLEDWYDEQRRLNEERNRPKELPADLLPWLEAPYEIGVGNDDGYIQVLESAEWVKEILETDRFLWPDLYECVRNVLDSINENPALEVGVVHREVNPSGRTGVECYRPDALTLYLSRVLRLQSQDNPSETDPRDRTGAERSARRSYPAWILSDRDQWFEVQDQKESNLSLSPEEQALLDAVAGHGAAEHRLPLFINGQAGSGKSTMLAYIFAGLLARQHGKALPGRPLFITYNQQLLERAHDTADRLLQHDANFLNKNQKISDGAFVTWRDFLLSLLPPERLTDFEPRSRIDFHEFKLAWERRGGRLPNYQGNVRRSAEFVWFVIRALIKGSDSVEDLTPEEFSTVASRERTIEADEFAEIFNNVYQSWYVPGTNARGLWDDQDLVSAVLSTLRSNNDGASSADTTGIVALVVDEAQDFTRRELRLLTRLLVFANYRTPQYGQPLRIPMVLAGDPLQTLSPTGFDWSRIRAAMHEEFGLLFGPGAKVPELEVLNFNYRSSQPIVQIGNSVQLWRSKLFGLDGVRAQSAWNPATALRHPEKFLFGDIREDDFIRFARDTVIVVPSDEGGEEDFIAHDATLSRMFQSDADLSAEGFVFSPMGIKGLEFKKVILYKFGEACPHIEWRPQGDENDRDLHSEYFFNKLYVGVSRATELLFIIDTELGNQRLWSQFDFDALDSLAGDLPDSKRAEFAAGAEVTDSNPAGVSGSELRALLGHVEVGAELGDLKEENPKSVADDIRRYGIETRNPTKMRQAAAYYRRSAHHELAMECEGYALRYEDRLLEAAQQFQSSLRFDLSWECRWEESDWQGLEGIAERVPNAPALQRMAVRLMSTPALRSRDLLVLHDGFRGVDRLPRASEPQWVSLCDRLATTQTDEMADLDVDELDKIVETLDRMFEHGFRQLGPVLARALLGLGDADRALKIAERSSSRLEPDLAIEIAETIGFPAGLRTLAKAGLHGRIVEAWIEAERPSGNEWHDQVIAALQAAKRHGELIELLLEQGRSQRAADYLAELCETGQQRNDDHVVEVIESLAADGALHAAFDLLDRLYEVPTLTALPRPIMLRSQATVAWARAEEQRGWPELTSHTRQLLNSPAHRMLDSCRGNVVRHDDVPALGALVETALSISDAKGLYALYSGREVRSPRLQKYARDRFLTLLGQEINAMIMEGPFGATDPRSRNLGRLRSERQTKAKEWGYTGFKDIPDNRKAVLGEEQQRVEPKGERHGIAWAIESNEHGPRIEITQGNAWFARYSITTASFELLVGVEPDSAGDSNSFTTRDEVTVTILPGETTEIRFTSSNGAAEAVPVYRPVTREVRQNPRQRNSRQRRRQGVAVAGTGGNHQARTKEVAAVELPAVHGPIKAHKLARELGLDFRELNARAIRLGFPPRNGNAPFSGEEADQLREGHP